MRDQASKIHYAQSLVPKAYIATTNGSTVDTAGFDSITFDFNFGVITDGTHTPSLQDSPDGATWTAVPAANLVGALANGVSNTIQKVGYIGPQPYVRAVTTVAGATTGGIYSATAVCGHPSLAPTS